MKELFGLLLVFICADLASAEEKAESGSLETDAPKYFYSEESDLPLRPFDSDYLNYHKYSKLHPIYGAPLTFFWSWITGANKDSEDVASQDVASEDNLKEQNQNSSDRFILSLPESAELQQVPSHPALQFLYKKFSAAKEVEASGKLAYIASAPEISLAQELIASNPFASNSKQSEPSRRAHRAPVPKRIDINHIEGEGVGNEFGFTKLKMILGPEYQPGHFLPLAELDAAVFDDGKVAGTAGMILRYIPEKSCQVVGFGAFYDFRQGKYGWYNQVSASLEVLNKRWELHLKGGAPVGKTVHGKRRVFDHYTGGFFAIRTTNEIALNFAEATAGYYLVNGKKFQLYAAAGPYYQTGRFDRSTWGGRAVLRPQFYDWFQVELSVSRDDFFGTLYQVNAILTIPLYHFSSALKNKKGPCGMTNRQIYQPIDPEILLLKKCCWRANFGETAVCWK